MDEQYAERLGAKAQSAANGRHALSDNLVLLPRSSSGANVAILEAYDAAEQLRQPAHSSLEKRLRKHDLLRLTEHLAHGEALALKFHARKIATITFLVEHEGFGTPSGSELLIEWLAAASPQHDRLVALLDARLREKPDPRWWDSHNVGVMARVMKSAERKWSDDLEAMLTAFYVEESLAERVDSRQETGYQVGCTLGLLAIVPIVVLVCTAPHETLPGAPRVVLGIPAGIVAGAIVTLILGRLLQALWSWRARRRERAFHLSRAGG